MDPTLQYALAYSLTTAAGLRAGATLAAVSVAAHAGWIVPPAGFGWLASSEAMICLIAVALVEAAADKVPLVDHVLHIVQIVIKPAAAAIVVGGIVHAPNHAVVIALMVVGALNALGIHAGVATLRGASTATTAGLANPAVSTGEDVATLGGITLSFVAPLVAAILALAFAIAMAWFARSMYRHLARR